MVVVVVIEQVAFASFRGGLPTRTMHQEEGQHLSSEARKQESSASAHHNESSFDPSPSNCKKELRRVVRLAGCAIIRSFEPEAIEAAMIQFILRAFPWSFEWRGLFCLFVS